MTRPEVVRVTTVSSRDVEIVIVTGTRAKSDPTAVVIILRLIERQHCLFAGG